MWTHTSSSCVVFTVLLEISSCSISISNVFVSYILEKLPRYMRGKRKPKISASQFRGARYMRVRDVHGNLWCHMLLVLYYKYTTTCIWTLKKNTPDRMRDIYVPIKISTNTDMILKVITLNGI